VGRDHQTKPSDLAVAHGVHGREDNRSSNVRVGIDKYEQIPSRLRRTCVARCSDLAMVDRQDTSAAVRRQHASSVGRRIIHNDNLLQLVQSSGGSM
jgi:hypothetical protein